MKKKMNITHLGFMGIRPDLDAISRLIEEATLPTIINSVSWATYPYCPEVKLYTGWWEKELLLKYVVTEESSRATFSEPNTAVHLDSCVEFFINPGDGTYFNFELNPIGTCYLGHGKSRQDSKPIPQAEMVTTVPSLGKAPFTEREGKTWTLTVAIPLSIFKGFELQNPSGLNFEANFYKCGDELKTPHFISWNPISTPQPDFHRPDFFGTIHFEPARNSSGKQAENYEEKNMLKGNAVIGQSGGPTSVINSSLAGVISAASKSGLIEEIYGMNYGIEGFMNEKLIDLGNQDEEILQGLRRTPSSALGSSRHKLIDEDFPVILSVLRKYNIRYFFLIGGNDTMDTIHRIEKYCRENSWELRGIGIPKTVDNDLYGTDHTPGFPSAAKYNILSVLQSGVLARDMQKVDKFVVYQTIGRDAGWLAAATALARKKEGDAPHLIYCPERRFKPGEFLEDVLACEKKYGFVSIVVSEGLLYEDGSPVSAASSKDKFNNTEFGAMGGSSVGLNVHRIVREATGWRGEFQITESLNMSAIDRAVPEDLKQAFECGEEAVKLAEEGNSGYMVTIERIKGTPVQFKYGSTELSKVAVRAKSMPEDFITPRGNDVTEKLLEYMRPLVPDLPAYVELKKVFAKK
ncbi:MAG: diphosphate--fructose-6-phosphate 1-phosphotransferase [Spirochaetales bacterium]|nr:diphosphate--fructose-6-phosphate 1-phosphotransferase [Spirochaetales bacterium]